MSELNKIDRMDIWNEIVRAFTELDAQTEGTSKLEDQAHLAIEVFERAALMQKEQGWRPMSEVPLGDLVLVRTDRGTYHTAYRDDYNGGTWWIAGTTVSVEPTEWAHIPTPPQGGSHE